VSGAEYCVAVVSINDSCTSFARMRWKVPRNFRKDLLSIFSSYRSEAGFPQIAGKYVCIWCASRLFTKLNPRFFS